MLAARRAGEAAEAVPWTLSPSSLLDLPAGTRLVLPSPNGSALSFAAREAGATVVLAGCLRNAGVVAAAAAASAGGEPVGVLAAGERWRGQTGSLRPAVEDLLGAGAVVASLPASLVRAPEAMAAQAAFASADDLARALADSASGRELAGSGRAADVGLAAELDADDVAPRLVGEAYVADGTRGTAGRV